MHLIATAGLSVQGRATSFHWEFDLEGRLHKISIERGSSARPAVVMTMEIEHARHVT